DATGRVRAHWPRRGDCAHAHTASRLPYHAPDRSSWALRAAGTARPRARTLRRHQLPQHLAGLWSRRVVLWYGREAVHGARALAYLPIACSVAAQPGGL